MTNANLFQPNPQTTAEYEAEFDLLMQEAENINSRMHQERSEIERLKLETKVLAEDTRKLKDETRSLLVSMGAKI